MGRMSKTRAKYRISQRLKYEDTKPEQLVSAILDELRQSYFRFFKIYLGDDVTLTADFGILGTPFKTPPIAIEVDGPYHDTPIQQRKTKWRDGLLTKAGYRVIHVDAELTKNKAYQTYLKDKLALAINSDEKVVRIEA